MLLRMPLLITFSLLKLASNGSEISISSILKILLSALVVNMKQKLKWINK